MNASGAGLAVAERPLPKVAEQLGAETFGGPWISMPPQSDPISAGLKKLFETVADEPIPDDFLNLLDKIDAERARIDQPAPVETKQ